jgi:hypothetical protein
MNSATISRAGRIPWGDPIDSPVVCEAAVMGLRMSRAVLEGPYRGHRFRPGGM